MNDPRVVPMQGHDDLAYEHPLGCGCNDCWDRFKALPHDEQLAYMRRVAGVSDLHQTLDALAAECRTLRGLVTATPRRWWRPAMVINLAPPKATPRRWAFLRAFWRVRRDVWTERESRLVAKWESYG